MCQCVSVRVRVCHSLRTHLDLTFTATLKVESADFAQEISGGITHVDVQSFRMNNDHIVRSEPYPPDSMRDAVLTVSPNRQ